MSAAEDKLTKPEPRRDRWGRYLIGGVAHTRATTVSGTLADTFALTAWKQRMVAVGLAKRSDLHALVASTDPDDKTALNSLCEDAMEAAGAGAAANLGTALHAFIAQINDGHDITPPPMWQNHVDAYRAEISRLGLTVVPGMVEQTCVLSGLAEPIAGTFDLLAHLPGRDLPLVCDLKTGGVEYGATEFAVQLAIYANAQHLYDPAADAMSSMPAVDREQALIIHLPAKENPPTCTIYELDIAAGWERVQTALEVRAWRKRKDLLVQFSGTAPTPVPGLASGVAETDSREASGGVLGPSSLCTPDAPPARDPLLDSEAALRGRVHARRDFIAGRIEALSDELRGQVAARWPKGVPTLRVENLPAHTMDTLDQVQVVVQQVEAEAGLPFGEATDPEMTHLPADHPLVTATVGRLQQLPADLVERVIDHVRGEGVTGKLTDGRKLPKDLAVVQAVLVEAEKDAEVRRAMATNALSVLRERGLQPAVVLDAVGNSAGDANMTAWQVDRLDDLADSPAGWFWHPDAALTVTQIAADELVGRWPNRRDFLNAAKQAAKTLGLAVPSNTDAALADPLLVAALAVAEAPQQQAQLQQQAHEQGATAA